jgi:hypothetical protein
MASAFAEDGQRKSQKINGSISANAELHAAPLVPPLAARCRQLLLVLAR